MFHQYFLISINFQHFECWPNATWKTHHIYLIYWNYAQSSRTFFFLSLFWSISSKLFLFEEKTKKNCSFFLHRKYLLNFLCVTNNVSNEFPNSVQKTKWIYCICHNSIAFDQSLLSYMNTLPSVSICLSFVCLVIFHFNVLCSCSFFPHRFVLLSVSFYLWDVCLAFHSRHIAIYKQIYITNYSFDNVYDNFVQYYKLKIKISKRRLVIEQ